MRFRVKIFKMTKTSQFCSIHKENTCKSSLHWNLIILTDFTVLQGMKKKLQNLSNFIFPAKVRVCDLRKNLISEGPAMQSRSKFDND